MFPKRARRWKLACGEAEPCNRRRGKGAHCLSAASLRAAGVGGTAQGTRMATPGPTWFWFLLLHNKGCALRDAPSSKLGYRAETRLFKVKVRPQNILGEQIS